MKNYEFIEMADGTVWLIPSAKAFWRNVALVAGILLGVVAVCVLAAWLA